MAAALAAAVFFGWWGFARKPTALDNGRVPAGARAGTIARAGNQSLHGLFDAEALVSVTADETGGVVYDARLLGAVKVATVVRDDSELEAWEFEGALSSDSLTETERSELESAFRQPFLVKRSALGQVDGIYFRPRLSRAVQTTWRSLVLETQFRGGTGTRWETVEWDNNGKYTAIYTVRENVVRKERSGFVSAYHKNKVPTLILGETEFRIDRGIVALDAVFELQTKADMIGAMSCRVKFAMKRKAASSSMDTATVLAALGEVEFVSLSAAGTATSVQEEHDQSAVQGFSWETALAALQGDKGERAKASAALVSLMRLQPELVDRALEHIRRQGPLAEKLIHRLGQASTPESLAALTRVAEGEEIEGKLQHTAITAMGFVSEPTEAMLDWLGENLEHEQFAQPALLAYGSAARALEADQQAQRDEIASRLVEGASQAEGKQREYYVAALGNAGVEEGLSTLEAALKSDDEALRSQATLSLRHVEGTRADFLLVEQLASGSSDVKLSALRAMGYRSVRSPLVEALVKSMTEEPSVDVRGAAVTLALRWSKDSPAVYQALQVVAEQDTNNSIRQAARNYLGLEP